MGNRYTKSISLSFDVLKRLEEDAAEQGETLSNVLDIILRQHYDMEDAT